MMNPIHASPDAYRVMLTELACDALKWERLSDPSPRPGEIIRLAFGQPIACLVCLEMRCECFSCECRACVHNAASGH
jgi:hypothetical protein